MLLVKEVRVLKKGKDEIQKIALEINADEWVDNVRYESFTVYKNVYGDDFLFNKMEFEKEYFEKTKKVVGSIRFWWD